LPLACCLYASAVIADADVLLDAKPPHIHAVTLVGKYVRHSKSTSYNFVVAPWGPYARPETMTVDSGFYESVEVGGHICMAQGDGWLGIRWYRPLRC
jgi:hypothetical protein